MTPNSQQLTDRVCIWRHDTTVLYKTRAVLLLWGKCHLRRGNRAAGKAQRNISAMSEQMRWDPYRIWTTKIVRISLVVKKKKVPYIIHASYNLQVIATVFLRPWIRFVTELSLTINFIIIIKNLVLLPKPMCIAASSRWIIIWSRTPNLRRLPRRNKGDCYGGYFEGLPFLGGGCFTKAWQMNSCPGGWIYVYERSC
jgi:hypothetical protein